VQPQRPSMRRGRRSGSRPGNAPSTPCLMTSAGSMDSMADVGVGRTWIGGQRRGLQRVGECATGQKMRSASQRNAGLRGSATAPPALRCTQLVVQATSHVQDGSPGAACMNAATPNSGAASGHHDGRGCAAMPSCRAGHAPTASQGW